MGLPRAASNRFIDSRSPAIAQIRVGLADVRVTSRHVRSSNSPTRIPVSSAPTMSRCHRGLATASTAASSSASSRRVRFAIFRPLQRRLSGNRGAGEVSLPHGPAKRGLQNLHEMIQRRRSAASRSLRGVKALELVLGDRGERVVSETLAAGRSMIPHRGQEILVVLPARFFDAERRLNRLARESSSSHGACVLRQRRVPLWAAVSGAAPRCDDVWSGVSSNAWLVAGSELA
jgi:hypothetical protein